MTQRQRKHIRETLPLMIISIALVAFCAFSALSYGREAEDMLVLSREQLTLDYDTEFFLEPRPQTTRLNLVLPEEFDLEWSVCFYSVYQEVRAYLDGREVYAFLKPEGEKMMKAAPSYWNIVELPAGSAGKTLEIELATPYPQYADLLPEVRAGDAQQVSQYVMMKTLPRFVLALAILLIGLVFAIVAIIMRYYLVGNTGLYSLSLFIVVLALFLVAQQTSILLRINSKISYILLQNIALMLCPVLYSRYLMRLHTGRLRKLDACICGAGIVNMVLVLALHFAGFADMPQMMLFTRILCALTIAYEFIQELRRRRRLINCLLILALIYIIVRYYLTDSISWLVYAGLFIYLYLIIYRVITSVVSSQAKQIRLEAQLEVSRSEIAAIQITSHFFYHTLDSIRALIRLDADKAYKMTGDFAKYVRHRVDGVERMQEPVPFSRELRAIRAYTDIKQAQLGDRFQMIFDLETEEFEILPLTVQPLVENAVIHAVQKRREGGIVRLVCRETQAGYHLEVIDNGPGTQVSRENSERREATAIRNLITRLDYYGIASPVFIQNELGGMTVSLDLPKKIARKGNME